MSSQELEPRKKERAPYAAAISKAEERFHEIADDPKSYERESVFAMQALMKTDYAMKVANRNPLSVQLAMINVASTGLTLNPANGYAYLVPRDNSIMLDISYKGLIKIATDTGSVIWVRADLVYEADDFIYNGPARMPDHRTDPFQKDRGKCVGVYAIAKTKEGDVLTEVMSMDELEKIRGKSSAYVKSKSGPWVEFFGEMARKSVIKRASKTWPYTDKIDRLLAAVEMANEAEGGYDMDHVPVNPVTEKQAAAIRDTIEASGIDEAEILALYDVETIDAIPHNRFREVIETVREAGKSREARTLEHGADHADP